MLFLVIAYPVSAALYAAVYWGASRTETKRIKAYIRIIAAVVLFTPFIVSVGHSAAIGPIWSFVLIFAAGLVVEGPRIFFDFWLYLLGMAVTWLLFIPISLTFYLMIENDENS